MYVFCVLQCALLFIYFYILLRNLIYCYLIVYIAICLFFICCLRVVNVRYVGVCVFILVILGKIVFNVVYVSAMLLSAFNACMLFNSLSFISVFLCDICAFLNILCTIKTT